MTAILVQSVISIKCIIVYIKQSDTHLWNLKSDLGQLCIFYTSDFRKLDQTHRHISILHARLPQAQGLLVQLVISIRLLLSIFNMFKRTLYFNSSCIYTGFLSGQSSWKCLFRPFGSSNSGYSLHQKKYKETTGKVGGVALSIWTPSVLSTPTIVYTFFWGRLYSKLVYRRLTSKWAETSFL